MRRLELPGEASAPPASQFLVAIDASIAFLAGVQASAKDANERLSTVEQRASVLALEIAARDAREAALALKARALLLVAGQLMEQIDKIGAGMTLAFERAFPGAAS